MGRGTSKASGGSGGAKANEQEKFVNEMVEAMTRQYTRDETPFSNSDLEGAVEAYAMTHKGVDENALLDTIRDKVDTKTIEKSLEGVKGYEIETPNGESLTYYFTQRNGNNYYKTSIGGIFEPTPNNMSEKQLISNAKKNNKVTSIKKSDMVDALKKRKKDREETNKFLTQQEAQNKTARQHSKANRIASRVRRRGR